MPIVGHRIRAVQLTAPIAVLPTDDVRLNGPNVEVVRDGIVIASQAIGGGSEVEIGEPATARLMTELFILEEIKMPGQNVSCTRVTENAVSGSVTFHFSSGNSRELPNWAAAGGIADTLDADTPHAEDILIGKAYRSSPDGSNKTNQVGASVSVNLLADVPVVYTEPD